MMKEHGAALVVLGMFLVGRGATLHAPGTPDTLN